MQALFAHLTGGETSTVLAAFLLGISVGAAVMAGAYRRSGRASKG
jgi:hypothetical protein